MFFVRPPRRPGEKGLDFKDFIVISTAIYNGLHKINDLKDLIIKLSFTMNNNRLSTNTSLNTFLTNDELIKLINHKPVFIYLPDGRIHNTIDNKLYIYNSCTYQIVFASNDIIYLSSIKEISSQTGISYKTLNKKLKDSEVEISGSPARPKFFFKKKIFSAAPRGLRPRRAKIKRIPLFKQS